MVSFNAARGFVGGAAEQQHDQVGGRCSFNAARGFVGGAAWNENGSPAAQDVSMPHAALWVVQRRDRLRRESRGCCFNAARGFVGGAASSLAALVPLGGKSPFGKSPEIRAF